MNGSSRPGKHASVPVLLGPVSKPHLDRTREHSSKMILYSFFWRSNATPFV
jgi:hypothetical protein